MRNCHWWKQMYHTQIVTKQLIDIQKSKFSFCVIRVIWVILDTLYTKDLETPNLTWFPPIIHFVHRSMEQPSFQWFIFKEVSFCHSTISSISTGRFDRLDAHFFFEKSLWTHIYFSIKSQFWFWLKYKAKAEYTRNEVQ